jgi:hypothetical protein
MRRRVTGIKLMKILSSIPEVSLRTRWCELSDILAHNPDYQSDPQLKEMAQVDLLTAWEDYVVEMQKREDLERQAERDAERRLNLVHRESFKRLLRTLQDQGKFNALSTWSQLYHDHLEDHPEFRAIARQFTGSGPLDYFWDALEPMQRAYSADKSLVTSLLSKSDLESIRSLEHLKDRLRGVRLSDNRHIEMIYKEIVESLRKDTAKESPIKPLSDPSLVLAPIIKRSYSDPNLLRRLTDAYKAFLSTATFITPASTYAEARQLLAKCKEFVELEDEDRRKYYFEKAVKKAKLSKETGDAGNVKVGEEEREEGEV